MLEKIMRLMFEHYGKSVGCVGSIAVAAILLMMSYSLATPQVHANPTTPPNPVKPPVAIYRTDSAQMADGAPIQFRFETMEVDTDNAVNTDIGTPWAFSAPLNGIYHVDVHFGVAFDDKHHPNLQCGVGKILQGQTQSTFFYNTASLGNPSCDLQTDFRLQKADKVIVNFGKSSALNNVTGRFAIHFIRAL
jgi:hypothetical protein